jgi:hypothetical protein
MNGIQENIPVLTLETVFQRITEKIDSVNNNFDIKFSALNNKFDNLNYKFENLNDQFVNLDNKFGKLLNN